VIDEVAVLAETLADKGRPREHRITIRLHNPSRQVGFFERAEITSAREGDEILPIEYSDNYVTVFPGETVELQGTIPGAATAPHWVRVTGYNTPPVVVPIDQRARR
jgi:exo-1,4-beta-D-glucosaminidase